MQEKAKKVQFGVQMDARVVVALDRMAKYQWTSRTKLIEKACAEMTGTTPLLMEEFNDD